jgi:glycosyltransferase involved in cell wall biosynthesis
MSGTTLNLETRYAPPKLRQMDAGLGRSPRPVVSVVVPAYNEAALIETSLRKLCDYMRELERDYDWEVLLINDGSTDETGDLVEAFARRNDRVRVFHHLTNFGLGQAFRFAFRHCRGQYIVTLDADLSYDPDHIRRLLAKIVETRAKIVVASPYMSGGRISNVPWPRRTLSVWANRFLAATSESRLSTLTSMMRAYDGRFLRSLDLRAKGMEVMPEIIYKARMLGARIEEIPAHLDWGLLRELPHRKSSMRLWRNTIRVILAGFLFRPVIFFILPGLLMLVFAAYVNGWMISHFLEHFRRLTDVPLFFERASAAVGAAYGASPHTFIVGISGSMLAIQLISLGVLALQSKNYFEEMFHLASAIYRANNEAREVDAAPGGR